jgi:sugar phosphate isomerase/epimerase
MQLGFVSAILGDLSLQEVLAFAADEGFDAVELMCWPPGSADRRYAGVCHLDVTRLCAADEEVHLARDLFRIHGITISGLGYYPNPLDADPEHRKRVVGHLFKVIEAAGKLGVGVVNTFIGRDQHRTAEDNWPVLREVWPAIVARAEQAGVTLGIENCPMLFTDTEWPGGRNLASSPAEWRRLFAEFPGPRLGLNLDPSHLVWMQIDVVRCVKEFGQRIVHIHAKDTRIDRGRLHEVGVTGLGWHTPKLPGLGEVDWGAFFGALTDVGYRGPVCIEVEDRAYEGSLADRKRALRQSRRYLEQWV